MKVPQNAFSGRDVPAAGPAVVAGVGFHLGDEVVLVLCHDHLAAPLTRHLDGHIDSLGG